MQPDKLLVSRLVCWPAASVQAHELLSQNHITCMLMNEWEEIQLFLHVKSCSTFCHLWYPWQELFSKRSKWEIIESNVHLVQALKAPIHTLVLRVSRNPQPVAVQKVSARTLVVGKQIGCTWGFICIVSFVSRTAMSCWCRLEPGAPYRLCLFILLTWYSASKVSVTNWLWSPATKVTSSAKKFWLKIYNYSI